MASTCSKVSLRDFDIFKVFLDEVTNLFTDEVQNMPSIDDEAKKRSCQQFKEVFHRSINNNVDFIGHQLETNANCKDQSEKKKIEKEKLDIFNTIIYPQLTTSVEEVAKKRKIYPSVCCQPITEQLDKTLENVCNGQLLHMGFPCSMHRFLIHKATDDSLLVWVKCGKKYSDEKVKVSESKLANSSTSCKSSHSSLVQTKDEFLKLARESSSYLTRFKKDADQITKRAGRLKLAQGQWMANRTPKIIEER